MIFQKPWSALFCFGLMCGVSARAVGGKPNQLIKDKRALQSIVTWDEHSILVRGERIMLFEGEFHPYRLPSPGLWLDVLQKVKALGFSGVSFYTDWALHEGKEGNFTAEGVFALEPFFDAASQAGIYLVARPGPYINAETSGGGFPGWLSRKAAIDRTPNYVQYTNLYVQSIGAIIAKAQITNGGPVVLLQPENEYSQATPNIFFPDPGYFASVEQQYRDVGIVVPFISNDAYPHGYFAPGTGEGAVDIYGHDGYPLGFDCANPTMWPAGAIPTYYLGLHQQQSPNTPYTIAEFQGGSFDPWGGSGFEKCAQLLNEEFERVFYKNNYAIDVTIFNLYMIYGGTNWGNLGYANGYTSYDYGASISEDRGIVREKYSEAKLEANFLRASPAYLTSTATAYGSNGSYSNTNAILITTLGNNVTRFFVARQANYASLATTQYKLIVLTSQGTLTIPRIGNSSLSIIGRDSKIHVVDYDVGGRTLLYSTAEIFTWQSYEDKTVLVLYGGADETHEVAIKGVSNSQVIEGTGITTKATNGSLILNWKVTPDRKVVQVADNLFIYLLWRNEAYNLWTPLLPNANPVDNYTSPSAIEVIVKAGYLVRSAEVSDDTLVLTGDLNATVPIEVIGAPQAVSQVTFNGKTIRVEATVSTGALTGILTFQAPNLTIPDLAALDWKYLDSLPEIRSDYDDSAWTDADLAATPNSLRKLTTPTSLCVADYGYGPGTSLFRGHFTASGLETELKLQTQGGSAFASSVFLDSTFVGSWVGNASYTKYNSTFALHSLVTGSDHVLTILNDNQGLEEDGEVGQDGNKIPRGILNYTLSGQRQSAISWKIQGNLGGEDYADRIRGPLNEGGLYAERQGYHLPAPPSDAWISVNPVTDGVPAAGVALFTTSFSLAIPTTHDVPFSVSFGVLGGGAFRAQLFVNGYQFGKFLSNVGPQVLFPVPNGILNANGENYVALTVWALEGAVKLDDLKLVPTQIVQSAYGAVEEAPQPAYSVRANAV